MKQDTLQSLLDKFREGTLTDGERTELERLSHKDEVFSAARSQAAGILRRRVALTVSALMICGAGIWAVLPGGGSQMSQVAEVVAPEVPAEPAPMVAEVHKTKRPVAAAIKKARPEEVAPIEQAADEPVVVCNSQCDADSVISDIRKFLCAI